MAAGHFRIFGQGRQMVVAPALILMTGATGFVGRQVLRELAERNFRVRAVVRSGTQDRLPQPAAIETIVATPDLWSESAAWWTDVCRGVDSVVHVAWYAEPGAYLPVSYTHLRAHETD